MVVRGKQEQSFSLRRCFPTKLSEIVNAPYDKFLIKFGAEFCPPCRNFHEYLEKGEENGINKNLKKGSTALFQVQLDSPGQEGIARELKEFFEFRSIPFCVVTDKNLQKIDSITGFSKEGFESLLRKHF